MYQIMISKGGSWAGTCLMYDYSPMVKIPLKVYTTRIYQLTKHFLTENERYIQVFEIICMYVYDLLLLKKLD